MKDQEKFSFIPVFPLLFFLLIIYVLNSALPSLLAAGYIFEPPLLLPTLNFVFHTLTSLLVVYFAARSYLIREISGILFLGCGALVFGLSSFSAAWFVKSTNITVAIHNIGMLISGIFHFSAAIFASPDFAEISRRQKRKNLILGYSGSIFLVSTVVFLAATGSFPLFYIQGVGPSLVRQLVIGSAILFFLMTGLVFLWYYFQNRSRFLYWYSLAMGLIAIGLMGVAIGRAVGGPIGWAGRIAQYTGGVYLLLSIYYSLKEAQLKNIPVALIFNHLFQKSDDMYVTLIENISDAIVACDKEGRILMWNTAAENMFGYSREDATGSFLDELILPAESSVSTTELLRSSMEAGRSKLPDAIPELEALHKNGRKLNISISPSTKKTYSGWVGILVIRNVTEKKQKEIIQAELAAIVENTGDAIIGQTLEGIITTWNKGAERMYGYSQSEMIGQSISVLSPPERNKELKHIISFINEGNHLHDFETVRKRKDGRRIDVVLTVSPICDAGNNLIGIFNIEHDITLRKTAQKILEERNNRLGFLSEMAGKLLILQDAQTYLDEIFPRLSRLLNLEIYFHFQPSENGEYLELKASGGVKPEFVKSIQTLQFGEYVCGSVAKEKQPYIVEKVQNSPDPKVSAVKSLGVSAYVCFPLITKGELLGTLSFGTRKATYFDSETILFLQTICNQIAAAIFRKKTEDALRSSELKFRTMAETIPDIVVTLTPEGNLDYVNSRLSEYTALSAESIKGNQWQNVFHPEDTEANRSRWIMCMKNHISFEGEFRVKSGHGNYHWFVGRVHPVFNSSGKLIQWIGSITDIHHLKQAQQELQEREKELRLITDAVPVLIAYVDARERYQFNNLAYETIFGIKREQIKGKYVRDIIGEENYNKIRPRIQQCLQGKANDYDVEITHKDGQKRWLHVVNIPHITADSQVMGFYVMGTDITDRKKMEAILTNAKEKLETTVKQRTASLIHAREQLKHLSSELLNAQENERKYITRELHDSIGQILTTIQFSARKALEEMALNKTEPAREALISVLSGVDSVTADIYRIQTNLRPPMLDTFGLLSTIEWFCEEFQKIYAIQVEDQLHIKDEDIPENLKIIIFRIIQEAFNNIAKHSESGLVSLFLYRNENKIDLKIQDYGKGFNISEIHRKKERQGLGLVSMQERVEYSGGQFFLASEIGKGTVIQVHWPI